jgi:hypothetical protein
VDDWPTKVSVSRVLVSYRTINLHREQTSKECRKKEFLP